MRRPRRTLLSWWRQPGARPKDECRTIVETNEAAFKVALNSFDHFAALDPEFRVHLRRSDLRKRKLPIRPSRDPLLDAWHSFFQSLDKPYDHLVFSDLGRGAEDTVISVLQAGQSQYGMDSTLLIATGPARTPRCTRLPAGTHLRDLSEFTLPSKKLTRLVKAIGYFLRPANIVNVDSIALWECIAQSGPAFSKTSNLYAFVTQPITAEENGQVCDKYFRSCFPYLTKLYIENIECRQKIIDQFGVLSSDRERLEVRQPRRIQLVPAPAPSS